MDQAAPDGRSTARGAAVSRRELLRRSGTFGAGMAAAGFLAACGLGDEPTERASGTALPPLAKELLIAQWPLYIDKAHGRSPTLDMFEKETGIESPTKKSSTTTSNSSLSSRSL